jgi:hypothetical protein
MGELAYPDDLKSSAERLAGSSPALGIFKLVKDGTVSACAQVLSIWFTRQTAINVIRSASWPSTAAGSSLSGSVTTLKYTGRRKTNYRSGECRVAPDLPPVKRLLYLSMKGL